MLSLVTISQVITAFHSCCLSHHVFDQVNLWSVWVGIETAIFWQCSPGTVETQRPYPLQNVVKKKQHKNYRDEDKKSAINKELILKIKMVFKEIDPQLHRFWQSIESSKEHMQEILKQQYCL